MALKNTVLAWSTQVPPICRVYEGQPMERALASWMMVLKGEELKGLLSDRGAARIILNCKSRKATVAQSSE